MRKSLIRLILLLLTAGSVLALAIPAAFARPVSNNEVRGLLAQAEAVRTWEHFSALTEILVTSNFDEDVLIRVLRKVDGEPRKFVSRCLHEIANFRLDNSIKSLRHARPHEHSIDRGEYRARLLQMMLAMDNWARNQKDAATRLRLQDQMLDVADAVRTTIEIGFAHPSLAEPNRAYLIQVLKPAIAALEQTFVYFMPVEEQGAREELGKVAMRTAIEVVNNDLCRVAYGVAKDNCADATENVLSPWSYLRMGWDLLRTFRDGRKLFFDVERKPFNDESLKVTVRTYPRLMKHAFDIALDELVCEDHLKNNRTLVRKIVIE